MNIKPYLIKIIENIKNFPSINIFIILTILIIIILIIKYNTKETFINYNNVDDFKEKNKHQARIAIVSLIKNPIDLPLWLKYHRNKGVKRFYIRLEDTKMWEDYLKSQPDVILEIGESDKNGNNYMTLIDRQVTFGNIVLDKIRKSKDIDWLYHIDADELLNGNIFLVEKLPKNIKTIKLENAEAVYDENDNSNCFSAKKFLKCSKGAPCKAYVNGKGGGICNDDKVRIAGGHDFTYDNKTEGEFRYVVPFDELHVLHFESCTFASWMDKYYHLSKKDKGESPFPYYNESIKIAKDAFELYKKNKMPDTKEIREDQLYIMK